MGLNFVMLILELWLLCIIALSLHWISPRYGLAPLLMVVGAFVGILRFASLIGVYVTVSDSLNFTVASNVFIPFILLMILILYIANGSTPTRTAILSLLVIEILSAIAIARLHSHLDMAGGNSFSGLTADSSLLMLDLRTIMSSGVAFIIDMFALAILFQAMTNYLPKVPVWISSGVAFIAVLIINALVFWSLASTNFQEFKDFLPGSILGSVVSGMVLWPVLAVYLEKGVLANPAFKDIEKRPTLDLIFGSFSRMERELMRSTVALQGIKAQYQHLTDRMSEVFWISDANQETFFYMSPAFKNIWQRDVNDLYANPKLFLDVVHQDDRARIVAALVRQNESACSEDFRITRPDKSIRWIHAQIFPLAVDQGHVDRVVGIASDITERKTLLTQEFELAAEREKVNLLRNFISEATHDIKSPLTAINLKVSLLESSNDPHQRQKYMNQLQNQTLRLSHMVENLLAISKLESSQAPAVFPVNITLLLDEIVQSSLYVAENKGIHLVADLGHENFIIRGEPHEFMRIFTNLVDNAIQYTPQEGTVWVKTRHDDAQQIIIEVQDTGIGISEEDLPHIFDRFYRSMRVRKLGLSGSGLGLAIVKSLVEKHNGTITVSSINQEGTTFRVQFPQFK